MQIKAKKTISKIKKLIIILLTVFAAASFSAMLNFAYTGGNDILNDNGTVSVKAAGAGTPTDPIQLPSGGQAAAWTAAVTQSINTNTTVTVKLMANWTASSTFQFGSGTGFSNGRITVPAKAKIILDLNGKTIDKGLATAVVAKTNSNSKYDVQSNYGTYTRYGSVFYVPANAFLEIKDTTSTAAGKITGGYSYYKALRRYDYMPSNFPALNILTGEGGGIYVNGGELRLSGGNISGNYAAQGGGVFADNYSTINIYGGKITGNKFVVDYDCARGGGGGMALAFGTKATMYGGEISSNGAVALGNYTYSSAGGGGGVLITATGYIPSGKTFTYQGTTYTYLAREGQTRKTEFIMNGGNISNNIINADVIGSAGGCLVVGGGVRGSGLVDTSFYLKGTTECAAIMTMNNGTVSNNTGGSGGGACILMDAEFVLNGGSLTGNTATSAGGGLYVSGGGANIFRMYGGEISKNNATQNSGNGGGICGGGADDTIYLYGGTVKENVALLGGGINLAGGTYKLGGPFQCYGNKVGSRVENVKIPNASSKFQIIGLLYKNGQTARIGITGYTSATTTITTGYTTNNNNTYTPATFFFGDTMPYHAELVSNEAAIVCSNYSFKTTTWSFKKSGDTTWTNFTSSTFGFDGTRASFTFGDATIVGIRAVVTGLGTFEWNKGTATSSSTSLRGTYKLASGETSLDFKTTTDISNAGTYSFAINNKTYSSQAATPSITIEVKQQIVSGFAWSITQGQAITYDGTNKAPTANYQGRVSAIFTINGTNVINNQSIDVGEYTAVMTSLSNSNYIFNTSSGIPRMDYSITPMTLEITWGSTKTFTYDGANHTPTYNSNAKSRDNITLTVSGAQKNAGSHTATVSFSGSGAGNYTLSSTSKSCNYTINKRTVTLTWGNTSPTYNGAVQKPTATAGNLVSGDTVTVTVTATGKAAGTYTATASAVSNTNYQLPTANTQSYTINKRTLTFGWSNTSLTYNGSAQLPTVSATNVVSGDTVTFTVSPSSGSAQKNAGTYQAHVSAHAGASAANYALPTSVADRQTTYTIGKKTITITWGVCDFTYDGQAHKPTATAGGVISGDTVTINVTGSTATAVGSYTATAASLSGTSAGNYQLPAAKTATYRINKKTLTVTFGTLKLTYNGQAQRPTVTIDGGTPSGVTLNVTVSGSTATAVDVGTYTVTAASISGTAASNYTLTAASKDFQIVALPITVDWGTLSFIYNGKVQTPKPTISNLKNNDNVTLSVTPSGTSKKPGSYTATLNTTFGGDSAKTKNYTLTGSTAEKTKGYTISKRQLTVTWDNAMFTYNGNAQQPRPTLTNHVEGETVSWQISDDTPAQVNAGNNYIARVILTGASYSVYSLPEVNGGSYINYVILPKPVSVDWDRLTFEYDAQPHRPVPTILAVDGKTEINCTTELRGGGLTDGEAINKGYYHIVVTSITDDNYTLDGGVGVDMEFAITPAQLRLAWPADAQFEYNGKVQYPTADALIVGDDKVTFSYLVVEGGEGINRGFYTVKITDYTVNGDPAQHENYTFYDENDAARYCKYEITRRVAEFTWSGLEKIYDMTTYTPTATVSNLVDGDVCYVYIVDEFIDAGDYEVTVSAISNTDNYTLSGSKTAKETLVIHPAALTGVTFNNVTTEFVYNGGLQSPIARGTGTVGGESCTVSVKGYKDCGTYVATEFKSLNKNYVLPEGFIPAEELTFKITPKTLTGVTLEQDSFEYIGQNITVIAVFTGLEECDTGLYLPTFTSGDTAVNAGSYVAVISGFDYVGDTLATPNYVLPEGGFECDWAITPASLSITVQPKDTTVDYTGHELNVNNWFEFIDAAFIGNDAGKRVTELYDVDQSKFFAYFLQNSAVVTPKDVGEYEIFLQKVEVGALIGKNGVENYEITYVISSASAVLTVVQTGGKGLKLIEGSKYDFLTAFTEDYDGEVYIYRRTYTQYKLEHGVDDIDGDNFVLGRIRPDTSIAAFVSQIIESQRENIKIYDSYDMLVYDCGSPGEDLTEEDLNDSGMFAVGTGWRVILGDEANPDDVVYLSVLGDVDGDGYLTGIDIAEIGRVLRGENKYTDLFMIFAADYDNSGDVGFSDIVEIGRILRGEATVEEQFDYDDADFDESELEALTLSALDEEPAEAEQLPPAKEETEPVESIRENPIDVTIPIIEAIIENERKMLVIPAANKESFV